MYSKSAMNSLIFNEFTNDKQKEYFNIQRQKFLHEIDTFYYSVKLNDDFTSEGYSPNVENFRHYWQSELESLSLFSFKECKFDNLKIEGQKGYVPANLPSYFILSRSGYASMYNIHISRPDYYDFFIALTVPNNETSQILVQIRSHYLWLNGINKAFDDSLRDVKIICELFGFTIQEVIENRVDYAWHTNYIQAPDKFFKLENVAKMRVSSLTEGDQHFKFRGNMDIELDYLRLGRLKSNNIIVRIYNKTKEVVEQGYKGFFYKIWQIHGLISRYDVYVYEECYRRQSWEYLHKARLKFYSEYGQNTDYKYQCDLVLSGGLNLNYDDLKALADKLTPQPTLILNIEYQTMRKFSKTIKLLPFRPFSGACRRIYTYFDNRRLIIDYLTHSVLRFVNYDPEIHKNKSRDCDYTNFWKRLRATKLVDCHVVPANLKIVRDYSNNLDKSKVKKSALGSIATYQIYDKGVAGKYADDVIDFMASLNDNDIEYMKKAKAKKIQQLQSKVDYICGSYDTSDYKLINIKTGEVIE